MIYEFGDFQLDEERWELRAHGATLDIPPKALETLALLLRHRERVVPSQELQATLWPNVSVTNGSLRKAIRIARLVLEDQAPESKSYIRTVRGRGYRFVAAVRELPSDSGGPSATMRDRQAPIVGRDVELEELSTLLKLAGDNQPTFLLVAGEAGIGKTRLLEAFEELAISRQARVAWGRCCEEGGAPELWPWIEIVRGLTEGGAAEEGLEARQRAAIRRFQQTDDESSTEPWQLAVTEFARFRLFDAIRELLRTLCRRHTLVLLLEDLHAADEATLSLARFLARDLKKTRLLVVATYRPADVPSGSSPGLRKLISDAPTLRLEGLSREDVERLVDLSFLESPDPALVHRLVQATEGNPLFITEILRDLSGRPDAASLRVPERVAEAIRVRLDSIADSARTCLQVAAVMGRSFEAGVLRAVTGLDHRSFTDCLDAAIRKGIVSPPSEGQALYRFRHMLFRTVLYEDLDVGQRTSLHRLIGETLEGDSTAGPSAPAAQLAHHFVNASLGERTEKAARYCLAAGIQAFRSFAYEEARDHLERAIGALGPDPTPDSLLCECLVWLGHAERLQGNYAKASETFARGFAVARAVGNAAQFAKSALGYSQVNPEMGVETNHRVIEVLEEAVRLQRAATNADCPDAQELLSLTLSRLVLGLFLARREEEARSLSEECLLLARAAGRAFPLAHGLQARHWVLWKPGTAEQRLAIADEMAGLARHLEDETPLLDARFCQVTDLMELGRRDSMYQRMFEYKKLAERLNDARALWQCQLMETTRALLEGRLEEAAQGALTGLHDGLSIHPENAQLYCGTQVWWAYIELGRGREVEKSCRDRLNAEPSATWLRGALLRLYAEVNDKTATRSLLEGLATHGFADLPDDWTLLPNLAHLAVACSTIGDGRRAALVHARLSQYPSIQVVLGPAVVYLGPLSFYLGLCCRSMMRLDEAITHFEHALEATEQLRARTMNTRARYYLAESLLLRGQHGDAARGLAQTAEALTACRQMGQEGVALRLVALQERMAHLEPA